MTPCGRQPGSRLRRDHAGDRADFASLPGSGGKAPRCGLPGKAILAMVQTGFARRTGCEMPVSPWALTELLVFRKSLPGVIQLGRRIYLKRAHGGYDGRRQIKLDEG